MAWNDPGNDNNDPWGNRSRKRGNNDGPPDLDEIIRNTIGKLFGAGGGGKGPDGAGSRGSSAVIVGLVVIGLVIFYFIRGAGIVNEQERAVVLRFGEYSDTRGPGFRWNPPFLDTVFTENVTRIRSWEATEQMLTQDLNIVDVRVSVQYSIDSAKDFVLNVKSPEDSLQQAANSALRHVVGSTVMHNVLTEGRMAVAVEVQERLQRYLANYQAGIRVEKVNIEETSAPRQVQNAFDDVIRAREDEERFKNEAQAYVNEVIPRARGQAQRVVEEALAYRDQVVARAQGESERFELLLAEFNNAPEVVRQRLYMDTMQTVYSNVSKVMVDVEGGNNLLYLPLDKLTEAGRSSGAAPIRQTTRSASDLDDLASRVADKLRPESPPTNSRRIREGR